MGDLCSITIPSVDTLIRYPYELPYFEVDTDCDADDLRRIAMQALQTAREFRKRQRLAAEARSGLDRMCNYWPWRYEQTHRVRKPATEFGMKLVNGRDHLFTQIMRDNWGDGIGRQLNETPGTLINMDPPKPTVWFNSSFSRDMTKPTRRVD